MKDFLSLENPDDGSEFVGIGFLTPTDISLQPAPKIIRKSRWEINEEKDEAKKIAPPSISKKKERKKKSKNRAHGNSNEDTVDRTIYPSWAKRKYESSIDGLFDI